MAINPPEPETLQESLRKKIKAHLDKELEIIVEEEVEKATNRIHQRIKAKQDQIAVTILKNYSMERRGEDLRIEIRHFFQDPNK